MSQLRAVTKEAQKKGPPEGQNHGKLSSVALGGTCGVIQIYFLTFLPKKQIPNLYEGKKGATERILRTLTMNTKGTLT